MVKHISDRVAVMYLGNMVELTSSEDLYSKPLHPYTRALMSAIPIPDPKVEAEREKTCIHLEGEVTSPINPPEGCNFCKRCQNAMEICKSKKPELREVEPGHFVACHCFNKEN